MATIAEYVEGIEASKLAIKNAIVAKGVTVADTDKLNTYASKIAAIEVASKFTYPNPYLIDDGSDYSAIAYSSLSVNSNFQASESTAVFTMPFTEDQSNNMSTINNAQLFILVLINSSDINAVKLISKLGMSILLMSDDITTSYLTFKPNSNMQIYYETSIDPVNVAPKSLQLIFYNITQEEFNLIKDKVFMVSYLMAPLGEIESSSDDGWTRPSDRPAVPTINENEIYMLFGVTATGPNDYAIMLRGDPSNMTSGSLTVDWGDGITSTATGMNGIQETFEHIYNYSTINVTPNTDGIKWVWIKFSTTTFFTSVYIDNRHSSRPIASSSNLFIPQVYEIYLNAPKVSTWPWESTQTTRYYNLEVFDWQGSNKLTKCDYFLVNSFNLKRFNMYTGLSTTFQYFLQNCYTFNQPINIDTNKGTNFYYFMFNCYSFNKSLNINTSQGTNFSSFLRSCFAFNQPIIIDTKKGTQASYFLYGCPAFAQSLTLDLTSMTTKLLGTMGTDNYALTGLRLLNMGSIHNTITVSNSSLGVAELILLFGDLYNRSSTTTGTLTITGAFGANKLTKAQLAIATSKNWTVTGASTID